MSESETRLGVAVGDLERGGEPHTETHRARLSVDRRYRIQERVQSGTVPALSSPLAAYIYPAAINSTSPSRFLSSPENEK